MEKIVTGVTFKAPTQRYLLIFYSKLNRIIEGGY